MKNETPVRPGCRAIEKEAACSAISSAEAPRTHHAPTQALFFTTVANERVIQQQLTLLSLPSYPKPQQRNNNYSTFFMKNYYYLTITSLFSNNDQKILPIRAGLHSLTLLREERHQSSCPLSSKRRNERKDPAHLLSSFNLDDPTVPHQAGL